MWQDPIIEEIHQTRQQIAEAFGNDMHAICEAARRGELHKAFITTQITENQKSVSDDRRNLAP